jgi:hypothetical protein
MDGLLKGLTSSAKLGLTLLVLLSLPLHAQVYRWIDSQGVVHFSDTPHVGADQYHAPKAQSFTSPTVPSKKQSMQSKPDVHLYKNVIISEPLNESTLRNNQGSFLVAVELSPALFSGDNLQLLIDGTPYGTPQTEVVFEVDGIHRGAHTLQIQVVNSKGTVLKTSEKITIFMHRPIVNTFFEPKIHSVS